MDDLVERLNNAAALPNGLYAEAAAHITELETALATVQRAAKTIMIHEADELRQLRDERVKWRQAITTLDSERQANALLTDRVEALETALAEMTEDRNLWKQSEAVASEQFDKAEGRVIAEVVAWLRHPDRRKLIEVEPAKPGYWTNDDEPEWVFSRSALKRLPNHKDFATALETGEWKK